MGYSRDTFYWEKKAYESGGLDSLKEETKRKPNTKHRVAEEGILLTESQLSSLEKKRAEKEAYAESNTEHRSYLGAQDTYYFGFIKGVGKIY